MQKKSAKSDHRRSIPAAIHHSRNNSQDSTWSSSTQSSIGSELSSFIYLQHSYNSGDATSAHQDLNIDKPGEEGQFSHSNAGLRTSKDTPHSTSIDTTEHNQEQYVCDMKVDGCYYTGQIDHESKSPHGSGKLRSEDGAMLEAEWKWGCCSFDV